MIKIKIMLDFNENIVSCLFYFSIYPLHWLTSLYFFIGFDDKAFVYDKIIVNK